MAFTLKQLRYFVAVAETGTVSGAAQTLSISQSAITEAVKDLEADLGVALFERHSRGLKVTPKGNLFFRHATSILRNVSDSRRALVEPAQEKPGRLSLGVTSLVAGYVLSDILSRYRRAYANVEVSTIEDNGDYLEHLLIGGELDVAIMMVSNRRDDYALNTEVLDSFPYRLWLPSGHDLASADRVEANDLSRERLIMLAVDAIEEATNKLLDDFGAYPEVTFRTKSVEAVRSLVATGAGVALLPDLVYRPWSLEGDRIESREIDVGSQVVEVGIVWRRGSELSLPASSFIAVARGQNLSRQR